MCNYLKNKSQATFILYIMKINELLQKITHLITEIMYTSTPSLLTITAAYHIS